MSVRNLVSTTANATGTIVTDVAKSISAATGITSNYLTTIQAAQVQAFDETVRTRVFETRQRLDTDVANAIESVNSWINNDPKRAEIMNQARKIVSGEMTAADLVSKVVEDVTKSN